MMGIVEEGEEVMAEGKKKDETAADLALIGAAQKVEHYEMSGYLSRRETSHSSSTWRRSCSCCSSPWAKRRTPISFSTSSPGH